MAEKDFSLFDILVALLKRKKFLIVNFSVAFLVAIGLSLLLPKSYKSTLVFIPPGQSASGILSMLGSDLSSDMLMGSKFSKRQYISLLQSRELREQLINKFNLIEVYKLRKMKNSLDLALKALDKSIIIKEEEEGGLGITDVLTVSLTVVDQKAQMASDMANGLFDLLEKKVLEMNQRESDLQIEFLKQQMLLDDTLLFRARNDLKTFQIDKKIYDIPSQVRMTVRALSQLEADKMSLEFQKTYLLKSFSSQYSEINSLNDKMAVCNQKIAELEQQYKSGLIPGLQKSLDLSNEYLDRLKEVETYVQLKFLLRQQLEIAKMKQQKSYTGISLIDHARPAQYKFKPKRAIVVLVITFVYMILLILWILFRDYYNFIRQNHPEKMSQLLDAVKIK
jgi:tyrosine-protein kinase Etk/Wzc